jgi:hypothetical protein
LIKHDPGKEEQGSGGGLSLFIGNIKGSGGSLSSFFLFKLL